MSVGSNSVEKEELTLYEQIKAKYPKCTVMYVNDVRKFPDGTTQPNTLTGLARLFNKLNSYAGDVIILGFDANLFMKFKSIFANATLPKKVKVDFSLYQYRNREIPMLHVTGDMEIKFKYELLEGKRVERPVA